MEKQKSSITITYIEKKGKGMVAIRSLEMDNSHFDTTDTARTSWNIVSDKIKSVIGDIDFQSWFLKCDGIIENNILTIVCPNIVVSDFIKVNFSKQLDDISNDLHLSWNLRVGYTKAPETKVNNQINNNTITTNANNDNTIKSATIESSFNQEFSWDNFIQSSMNNFAVSACYKVANEMNTNYSLLYLYGPAGSGKTHLLNAMVGTASKTKRVLMMSAHSFANDYVRSCRDNSIFDFKEKIRNCNMLIIDSIEELSSKDKTVAELMQAICDIMDNHGQVVISSSCSSSALTGFDKKFQSILSSGLSVDLYLPDSNVCEKILIKKGISEEIARYISTNIELNGHIITGIAKKLNTWTDLTGGVLTLDTVNSLLQNVLVEQSGPTDLVKAMCKILGCSYTDICSNRRHKGLVRYRYLIMAVLKQKTALSLEEIGKVLGNRDHATVLYGINKLEQDKLTDLSLVLDYENLMKQIKSI